MEILQKYLDSQKIKEFTALLEEKGQILMENTGESALSFQWVSVYKQTPKPLLLIFDNKEEAAYYYNDFEQIAGEDRVPVFSGILSRAYQIEETDNAKSFCVPRY